MYAACTQLILLMQCKSLTHDHYDKFILIVAKLKLLWPMFVS